MLLCRMYYIGLYILLGPLHTNLQCPILKALAPTQKDDLTVGVLTDGSYTAPRWTDLRHLYSKCIWELAGYTHAAC
jgi:hypothetical protein